MHLLLAAVRGWEYVFIAQPLKNYSLVASGLHCLFNKNIVGHSFEKGQFLFIKLFSSLTCQV